MTNKNASLLESSHALAANATPLAKSTAPATQAGTADGTAYYAFHNQSRLTLDLAEAPEQIAFAKTFDASGPHRSAAASLHELTLVGHYESQVTRLDGQTLNTTAGDSSLNSTIAHLTLNIADTADNQFNESELIVLKNFDGLQSVEGAASTVGLSLDFVTGFEYASQSAFLKSVTTGSGSDTIQISTIAAPELASVAALSHCRVKTITVDSGDGNDQIGAHIQQADMVLNAGAGNDHVDLLLTEGVAAHNATMRGSYGHGATVTLGAGQDTLSLLTPTLVNFDDTSSASANRSLAANHVTVTDFTLGDDSIIFGSSLFDAAAVTTVADATLKGATTLAGALEQVTHVTTGQANAAVFHYGNDTYVFHDQGTKGHIDTADSLIQLVGVHALDGVAASVAAGERGEGGWMMG